MFKRDNHFQFKKENQGSGFQNRDVDFSPFFSKIFVLNNSKKGGSWFKFSKISLFFHY